MRTSRSAAGRRGGRAAAVGLLAAAGLATALVAGCSAGGPATPAGEAGEAVPGVQQGSVAGQAAPEALPPAVRFAVAPADHAAEVSPLEPVKVTAAGGRLTTVTLSNAEGRAVRGQLSPDGQTWSSTEPLGYAKTYTVTATGTAADGRTATTRSTFSTVKPRTKTYASMNPVQGQAVGVGQPIAIYFDEPIKNKKLAEQSISVQATPAVNGAFYWFSDREVHWRPERYWRAGTKVVTDIKIYGKDLGGGIYGQEDRHIVFTIGDAVVAKADGESHTMSVEVNGAVVRTVPVSLGKQAKPSANGVHVVTEKLDKKIMDSSSYGVPVDSPDGYRTEVEWAVRISNSGEFAHAAPWSVRDQGHRNVSHGCVNMSPENAKWFFDLVKKGDVVVISNSGGPPLKSYDGFGDWQVPWPEWSAGGRK
jgi:lipoprotein-anchoring transpeptidase ErfK/SrfK